MAKKGIKPEEIIKSLEKPEDKEEIDLSSDSEKESDYEIKDNIKIDNNDTQSDSELEVIAKSFKEGQKLGESINLGLNRVRLFIEKNNQKLFITKKTIFLNKKRKFE
jgi:hypothetical protein